MGFPAARKGDLTVHTPIICTGSPDTKIGYMPAARLNDLATPCPLPPCKPPKPKIVMTSRTVFINRLGCARMGDVVNDAAAGVKGPGGCSHPPAKGYKARKEDHYEEIVEVEHEASEWDENVQEARKDYKGKRDDVEKVVGVVKSDSKFKKLRQSLGAKAKKGVDKTLNKVGLKHHHHHERDPTGKTAPEIRKMRWAAGKDAAVPIAEIGLTALGFSEITDALGLGVEDIGKIGNKIIGKGSGLVTIAIALKHRDWAGVALGLGSFLPHGWMTPGVREAMEKAGFVHHEEAGEGDGHGESHGDGHGESHGDDHGGGGHHALSDGYLPISYLFKAAKIIKYAHTAIKAIKESVVLAKAEKIARAKEGAAMAQSRADNKAQFKAYKPATWLKASGGGKLGEPPEGGFASSDSDYEDENKRPKNPKKLTLRFPLQLESGKRSGKSVSGGGINLIAIGCVTVIVG